MTAILDRSTAHSKIRIFGSYKYEVMPSAKQIFGSVPNSKIRSQQESTSAI